ncbi:uncharacterized protein [Panulirus ornatus]|uniref:uncharacterized protein n=1 Tax=Panulirus ornatus TaxID=150431 RepID=UPI003A8A97CC
MMGSRLWLVFVVISGVLLAAEADVASTCDDDEFRCVSDGECIPKNWMCDEFGDCKDKSDEPPFTDCSGVPGVYGNDDSGAAGGDSGRGAEEDAESPPVAAVEEEEEEAVEDEDEPEPIEEEEEEEEEDESDDQEVQDSGEQQDVEGYTEAPRQVPKEEPKERCALKKCQRGSKMQVLDGRTYVYEYVTESVTQVTGSSPASSKLTLNATLAVNALTACEMELVVERVSVMTSKSDIDGEQEPVEDTAFTAALTKNPVRFAYHNGVVEEVCPAPDEDPRSLNFKRAAISLLQNSMLRLDLDHSTTETDVVGTCQVDYVVTGAVGTRLLIQKTRNIPSCTSRSSTTSAVQGIPYAFIGGRHNIPLLNSSSVCVQEIGKGLVQAASCHEQHRFTPFSSEKGGIITNVTQNISFSRQTFSTSKMGAVHGRTDLRYDHHNHIHLEGMTAEGVDDGQVWRSRVAYLLDTIADNGRSEGVATNAPRLFIELVQAMRHLSFQQMWSIAEDRTWGSERSVFEDALPMVGTGASIGVMRDLMELEQVNDIMANTWLNSLAFIPRPDLDAISEAAPLLESRPVAADAFLGVGSLVHTYCRDHPSCHSELPVRRVMEALHGFLASSCREETSEHKIQVLLALKGIGNAGLAVTEAIPNSLAKCFLNESNENEIKVGAITAFRRFPCNVSREPLQNFFLDASQDSELRIAAYLELMRCADFQTVKLVKHMLLYEEVNQVGSFVWTHLQNLKETGMPSRAEVQGLLSNQEISSKFSVDVRKFSRNIEWSGFYDELNIGGSVDMNVVFSQKSYIPRSAVFNFTTDLFGHSLNLLEVGARVEGWDRYVDSIFRPTPSQQDPPGINNPKILDLIKKTGKQDEYLNRGAELSLHMKTFGSEIYYRHLHGMDKIMEAINTLNPVERIRLLNEGQDINLQKSWLAADSTFIIPTTAGLPLNLSLTASVALDIHASGNIDLSFFQTGRVGINGELKPSVGVEVVGSMLVDGHAAQSGVQLVSTLHSSTVVEGKFNVGGSESMQVEISMPRDKIDIVNITSQLVLVHGSAESAVDGSREVIEGVTSDRMEVDGCSGFQHQLAAKLCWNVQYPNASRAPESPFYPLTGPSQLQVVLHKTDPTLTKYQLLYTWERRREHRTFLLSVNTPGTATPREHSVKYHIDFDMQNIFLDLHSPQSNLSARGRYLWTDLQRQLDLNVALNGRETATLTAGLSAYSKSGRDIVTPIFTVTWLDQEIVKVSGEIDLRQKRESRLYEVNMQVSYMVPGDTGQWEAATGTISGELDDNSLEWNAKLDILYSPVALAPQESIRIEYRAANSSTAIDNKFETSWRFFFSQFPNINFKGQWLSRRYYGSVENDLQVNLGENFENPDHRVDIFHAYTINLDELRTTLNSTLSVKHRRNNVDLKVGGDWYHDDYVLNTGFLVQYATDHQVASRLHVKTEPVGFLNTQGDWFLKVTDGVDWQVKGEVQEKRGKTFKFEGEARSGTDWRVEVSGTYRELSSRLEELHNLLLDVRLPSYGLTRINATFHANDREMSLDTHVLTNSGQKYRGRAAYEHVEDDLQALGHTINLELHLPNQLYSVNTAVSVGTVITVTNDIHLDRYRDIHMSVKMDVLQPRQRGLQALLKWNANRDPNQKMDLEFMYETPSDRESTFTVDGLLFFLGQRYQANWRTHKRLEYVDRDLIWEHKNEGSLSWTDARRVVQEVTANMTMRLRRGDTAELYGKFDIATPFTQWKKNYLEVKYSRNNDHIESTLRSRWHDGEFIDLHFLAQKQIDDAIFRIETKLDVSSSFEGLVSASTGAKLEKKPNILDTNFYIQWDTDRLEITFEGKDDSHLDDLRYSVFGQIFTTIPGYHEMSSAVDLSLMPTSVDIHATTKWEDHDYRVLLNGEVYNGLEYLSGALAVTSLQRDEVVNATIRVYHDSAAMEERLSIVVKWVDEEVRVEGHVATLPQRFKAGIHINTTFEELERAAVVLGHSKAGPTKTEARIQWNDKIDVGFVVLGQATSLSDFLVSCTILTPFPGYKVITGELRNFFRLEPEVRVHSRIYGQLGEQKYGLGARYEQGQVPRLRIALELYTPLPELHTIFLDLCDNSTVSDIKYDLNMKYGPTKNLRLIVELQNGTKGVEGLALAILPLKSLDEHLSDVNLRATGSFFWEPEPQLDLTLVSETSTSSKLLVKGRFPTNEQSQLQFTVITPLEGYENLDFVIEYLVPDDYKAGHFDGRLSTPAGQFFQLTASGTTKDLSGSFVSPYEPFRNGTFMWKLTALDVLKSHLITKLGWEKGDIILDASVMFQRNFIQALYGTLETPWEDLEHSSIRLEGSPQEGGYRNRLVLEGAGGTYHGDLLWKYQDENNWEVDIEVEREYGGQQGSYQVHLGFNNMDREPFKLAVHLTTPHQGFQDITFDLMFQRAQTPYHLKVEWATPVGSGSLEISFNSLSYSDIDGKVSLTIGQGDGQDKFYTVEVNLMNDSAWDMIDVDGTFDLKSNHEYWNRLVLKGKVKQVTSKPGELSVYLQWPHLDPITFRAIAEHSDNFQTIKPTITLDLYRSHYSFAGEMRKQGRHLNLTGTLEWERGSSGPQQVTLHSNLVFNKNSMDGLMTFDLPMVEGWSKNRAIIHLETLDEIHWFESTIETGSDVTTVKGNMPVRGFPAGDGVITVTSTLMWESQPVTLNFKQELTDDGYVGDYHLQWPWRHNATTPWGRRPVHATLKHHYLDAGHRGTLQITEDFIQNKTVQINYGFKFPLTGDVSIELGATYGRFPFNVKIDRVTAVLAEGIVKQRTSFECNNFLWPFGISTTKESNRKSETALETETTLELYDLQDVTRRNTITIMHNTAQSSRNFTFTGKVLDREILLATSYDLTPENFHISFVVSWSEEERIEFDINWKDVSKGFTKEHILKGKFSQPYRTVLLDGYYKRSSRDINAHIKFNWDAYNPDEEEEVTGRLQWKDESTVNGLLHTAFVSLAHPVLEKDIKLAGQLRQNSHDMLAADMSLEYSPDRQKDVLMKLLVTNDTTEDGARLFVGRAAIEHASSNLAAETNGTVVVGTGRYELLQDFRYTNLTGHTQTASFVTTFDRVEKTLFASVETWRKLVDIRVDIEQDSLGRWSVATTSAPDQDLPLMTYLHLHPAHPVLTITFDNLLSNDTTFDTSFPRFIAEQVVIEGGIEDHRNARFSMKHLQPAWLSEEEEKLPVWVSDAEFFFRLNHSRLLTSRLTWRPEIEYELMSEVGELIGASYDLRQSLEDWINQAIIKAGDEALARTQPILRDLSAVSKPLLFDFRNESQQFVDDLWLLYYNINSTTSEMRIQDSLKFIIDKIMETLEGIPTVQGLKTKLESGVLRTHLVELMKNLQNVYDHLISDESGKGLKDKLKELLSSFAEVYDHFAKQLRRRVSESVQGFTEQVGEWLRRKWRAVYDNYKPHILRTFDDVETNAWIIAQNLMESLQRVGLEIKSSAYYRRIEELVTYLEDIYRDFTEKSKRENLEKYYTMIVEKVKTGMRLVMDRVAPFLDDWMNELWKAYETLLQSRTIMRLRESVLVAVDKVIWTVRYVDMRGHLMDAMVFLLEHGYTIVSQTSVQASQKHILAKTSFKFSPQEGEVELMQKLPVDWHAFDHTPNWRDLPEYKNIQWVREAIFSSSNVSILDTWYKHLNLNFRPSTWIPPFPVTGYMIGEQHFMTFDGRHLEFKGRCQHLLAADMVGSRWAIAVNYHSHSSRTIIVYVDGNIIELGADFRVTVDGRSTELPIGLPSATVHRWLHKVVVQTSYNLVTWNVAHDVVSISLHGVNFDNTGGLLGLYNNEPSDDLRLPDGSMTDVAGVLADAWEVSPRQCQSIGNIARGRSKVPIETCTKLFQSKGSPFKHCFFQIDPTPYLHMCLVDYRGDDRSTCKAATAYMEACSNNNIPVKIPVFCVQCDYMTDDGVTRTLEEGTSIVLDKEEILKSTDVVLLVEAGECNMILTEKKPVNRFETFISVVNEELEANGIRLVRYAMVVYGNDDPPFSEPTVVTVNNQIFTDAANIHRALNHVPFRNLTENRVEMVSVFDAFDALTFAAGLNFRAGVSVTFILFPCTSCSPTVPSMEYSTMYHILLEYSITLHVFNLELFDIPKPKEQKKIQGIDSENAYTLKDARNRGRPGSLTGDPVIRGQVTVPKNKLAYCAPLALENNGTIFTSVPLMTRKHSSGKMKKKLEKLAIVFGKRMAVTALPQERKRCVCVPSSPDGAASVQCDNWSSGYLSILEQYGDEDFSFAHETNSDEAGSCVRRNAFGECVDWLNSE